MESIFVTTPTKKYPIVLEQSFDALPDLIQKQNLSGRKMCIISDSNTNQLYTQAVMQQLKKVTDTIFCYSFAAGEQHKNLESISDIYAFLKQQRADRKTIIVALGGGVCGDMAGFAAATYLRGIPFIQIPTTLLSQVDSSVGGKTGVDFQGSKNIIGAFYQPEFVYINTSTLQTLPAREFSAGMAEVIKYGCILSKDFFDDIKKQKQNILDMKHTTLSEMIQKCCLYKADVVSKDEKESGLREILNFGHTIGHAIETKMDFQLLHGECVAIGMIAVMEIAKNRGDVTQQAIEELTQLLTAFHLPLSIKNVSVEEIYKQMFLDKKVKQNKIGFVLPQKIGQVYTTSEVSEEEIKKAIQSVVKSE